MNIPCTVVVGLGETGQSVGRFLTRHEKPFCFWDTRKHPPGEDHIKSVFPGVKIFTGKNPEIPLHTIERMVVSPGVDLAIPFIQKVKQQGIDIIGDVALFVENNYMPIVAITGSNGKSTVTMMLADMAKASGLSPVVVGNIGNPVLDALIQPNYDLVVMEISSFQLETTPELGAHVATILNLTPDHLDRHLDMASYQAAKQCVYRGAEMTVANRQDVATWPSDKSATLYFSTDSNHPQDWHVDDDQTVRHICKNHWRYPVSSLSNQAEHYLLNVCAAMAIAQCLDLDLDQAFDAACRFQGLKHRCEKIAEHEGVLWYNDSKATNVGATVSSTESVGKLIAGKVVLILGGVSKQTGFESLIKPVKSYVKHILLIGEATGELEQALADTVEMTRCDDMAQVVETAHKLVQSGDAVLLAPACASFDMFKNYADRGEQFERYVKEVLT